MPYVLGHHTNRRHPLAFPAYEATVRPTFNPLWTWEDGGGYNAHADRQEEWDPFGDVAAAHEAALRHAAELEATEKKARAEDAARARAEEAAALQAQVEARRAARAQEREVARAMREIVQEAEREAKRQEKEAERARKERERLMAAEAKRVAAEAPKVVRVTERQRQLEEERSFAAMLKQQEEMARRAAWRRKAEEDMKAAEARQRVLQAELEAEQLREAEARRATEKAWAREKAAAERVRAEVGYVEATQDGYWWLARFRDKGMLFPGNRAGAIAQVEAWRREAEEAVDSVPTSSPPTP